MRKLNWDNARDYAWIQIRDRNPRGYLKQVSVNVWERVEGSVNGIKYIIHNRIQRQQYENSK